MSHTARVTSVGASGVSTSKSTVVVISAAFMLFATYFGAGNLIFPAMIGATAGAHFAPVIIGFLMGAAILPVLGLTSVAVNGNNFRLLMERTGKVFSILFPSLIFLAIGPFYAVPRTGSVAYKTSFAPYVDFSGFASLFGVSTPEGVDLFQSVIFCAFFFSAAWMLAWNPRSILDTVGKILTPALLIFLIILILRALLVLDVSSDVVAEKWVESPLTTGFLEGYMTMDSLGAFSMGLLVNNALRSSGAIEEKAMVRSTIIVATISGILMSLTYLGLSSVGRRVPDSHEFTDGASVLVTAANTTLGDSGQFIFGAIVLLACLTTAVGLISAASQFFNELLPRVSYKVFVSVFAVLSFGFAVRGLEHLLVVIGPLVGFLYPIAIALIALAFVAAALKKYSSLPISFKVVIGTTIVWAALVTLSDFGIVPTAIVDLLAHSPWHEYGLGWMAPTLAVAVITIPLDLSRARLEAGATRG